MYRARSARRPTASGRALLHHKPHLPLSEQSAQLRVASPTHLRAKAGGLGDGVHAARCTDRGTRDLRSGAPHPSAVAHIDLVAPSSTASSMSGPVTPSEVAGEVGPSEGTATTRGPGASANRLSARPVKISPAVRIMTPMVQPVNDAIRVSSAAFAAWGMPHRPHQLQMVGDSDACSRQGVDRFLTAKVPLPRVRPSSDQSSRSASCARGG